MKDHNETMGRLLTEVLSTMAEWASEGDSGTDGVICKTLAMGCRVTDDIRYDLGRIPADEEFRKSLTREDVEALLKALTEADRVMTAILRKEDTSNDD